jgi:hypothetical protein
MHWLSPSLRAERSNPGAASKDWIASSQGLLARTVEMFRRNASAIAHPSSTASAPVTASALSITVRSSAPACTAMFSAKNLASVT